MTAPVTGRQPSPRRRSTMLILWLLVVVLGLGFTVWGAFVYIGIRARRRSWLAWAAVYAALAAAAMVLDNLAHPSDTETSIGGLAILVSWIGGSVHAAAIRKDAARRIASPPDTRIESARTRISRRAEGRRLAERDPLLAREAGVGRPDLPGADDFGLVDVNHAPASALCLLPGITPEIAALIEQTRNDVGNFTSAEDLCLTLNLPPALTGDLKEHAIFLAD